MNGTLILNGPPRRPLAEKVVELFRRLADGELLAHGPIEGVVGRARSSPGYYGIVGLARRIYAKESRYWIESVPGAGYQKPRGPEQIDSAVRYQRRAVRIIVKSTARVADVEDARLDESGRRRRDHIVRTTGYLAEVARTHTRAMIAEVGSPAPLPRRA